MWSVNWINVLAHWIVSAGALWVTAAVVPGFRIRGFFTCMVGALLIAVANIYVRPVLLFLTFPLTILTLGLFLFVVDAIVLRICAAFLKDFEITGWFSAIIGAIILSITSSLFHWLFI